MNSQANNFILTENKIITETELTAILKAIKEKKDLTLRENRNFHFIADYYLILLGSLTGCRVSEIINIKIKDVGENSLNVYGKGGKWRVIPLGKRGRHAIKELVRVKETILDHQTKSEDFLFLNRNRKPFTRHGVAARFRFWSKKVGIPRRINFHSLRHRFATYLLNQNFNLAEVQKILGHSSPQITSVYLHFTEDTATKVDAAL